MPAGSRTTSCHQFWLQTCGLDTHDRGSQYARQDTPWNSFTADKRNLVCTLWPDLIVTIIDPETDRARRFVKLGGRKKKWLGLAVAHGKQARANIEAAYSDPAIRIFGYEAEPSQQGLEEGRRIIRHFHVDRVHRLRPVIGLRGDDLNQRLQIDHAFHQQTEDEDLDFNVPAWIFELEEASMDRPNLADEIDVNRLNDNEEEDDESADDEGDEVVGKTSRQEYAKRALLALVDHVREQQDGVLVPLTYVQLAALISRYNKHGVPWARGLGTVLGQVTALVSDASAGIAETPPFLTTIVVRASGKDAGLPGIGIEGSWSGYIQMSRAEKQDRVRLEYDRILAYGSRWEDILRLADLIPTVDPVNPPTPEAPHRGWGGGESKAHSDLKNFVLHHPHLFGAETASFAQAEYALRSGDVIDVMFKSEEIWIGVEVKSRTSDAAPGDYERGIYQVVKYKAVLQAQASVDYPERVPSIQVWLALESKLPDEYRTIINNLRVQLQEGLTPILETIPVEG